MNKIKELLKQYRRLIILIMLIIIVVGLVVFGVKTVKNLTTKEELPTSSNAFFLTNDEGYYSLFNSDGKQLIDYKFVKANDFYNHVAKVKDKDSSYGIVNDKGKYIVKLGTYDNIYQYGSLFKVEDDSKYSLLNKSGKKIIKKSDFEVQTFTGINSFIAVSYNNKIIIYNYNGKKIYTFARNDKDTSNLSANEIGKYGSVYYNGLTIVFDITSGKIISKIKEDTEYCINEVSEDESIITLNSCTSWYEETKDIKYKIIKNNKLKDLKDNCDKVTLNNDMLICTQDDIRYLLNDKLKKVDINVGDITYQNYKNYAIKKDNNIEFIKNNKKVSTLKDAILADKGYSKKGIYLTYKDNVYTFYNIKGKSLFKKSYKKATSFDKFNLAKVSEDGENYYLINSSGKKVSPEFTTASISNDYYIYNKDNLMGILSNKGKVLIENKYTSINIQSINEHNYAIANNNEEYELIDLDTKKTILKSDTAMILHDSYITTSKDNKINYYNYKGKEFNK